ncbi:MAG: M28 family peptidase [Planctomycetes bacterium]|nr:M28 family peptidase [Planctomycetota bacterium]
MPRVRPILILAVLLAPLTAQQDGPVKSPRPVDDGEKTISADDLKGHIDFLASDEMKGRDAGSEEGKRAADYIRAHMEEHGLKPAGADKTWFHGFSALGRVCRNVCGVLPGKHSRLKREYVVIGAHYDHVGVGMRGSRTPNRRGEIHNGADDNASGTSALLELVEAFAKKPPKRSVLFLAFDAEEKGLLGSRAWCAKPTRPLGRIAAMLNLDMVGRSKDGYLFVGGINTGRGFESLLRKENKPFGFNLELHGGGKAPSDNASFYAKDIPVLFFFTAEHNEYHTPDDDIDLVNTRDQALITRLIYRLGRTLADGKRPRFQKDDRNAMPAASERGQDYVRSLLGVDVGPYDEQRKGLPVTRVRPDGLAATAHLKEGDVLLSLDGYKAESRQAVQSVLALKKRGDSIALRIKRKSRTLKTKLRVK